MKKLILIVVVFLGLLLFWYGESRKFICLDNGTCITVWKTFGNVCYIIPGKYYGLFKPTIDHVRTTNTALIDFFFAESLPKTMIFRCSDSVIIRNNHPETMIFRDFYTDEITFRELLFEGTKPQKLKDHVDLIFIDVHDSYSIDKNRKRLW